jgi:hypothetical protein
MHDSHYETVSMAISELKKKGFILDFNLEANCLVCNNEKYDVADFEIVDVYRYEGITDPADEATVYAIASAAGIKGIFVTGNNNSLSSMQTELLAKLKMNNR